MHDGIGTDSVWGALKCQIYFGDEPFVDRMQRRREDARDEVQIPKPQRHAPAPTLDQIRQSADSRDAAIANAHATGVYSYVEIAAFFGVHFTTVGRIARKSRREMARS